MDSDEEGVEQGYDSTCEENNFFVDVYRRYKNPKGFLQRSEKIFARGIRLNPDAARVWLNYDTDVDGCVVELKSISGFKDVVRHIYLCPKDRGSMKYVKSVLKKHLDLEKYSKDGLTLLNHCMGTQLFYEEGWECWIGLIPLQKTSTISVRKEIVMDMSYEFVIMLRKRFQSVLCEYVANGTARRTLMKNDLNDLRRIFVLPDDSAAILDALNIASEGFKSDLLRPIVFCFRFGEKMTSGVDLRPFNKETISKVTLHAAVDISSDGEIELMWSMGGIQEVVGTRGTLSTCLSFFDCGNFQSNLDGRLIDVRRELIEICRYPDRVKFVQMYADVPHRKPKSRVHPVSGVIAGGMCFPKPTLDAFCRDSVSYLSTLDSNWALMTKSTCRLEIVSEVQVTSDVIQAADVLDVKKVEELLQKKPMLVPTSPECLKCIREIGLWLQKELQRLFDEFQKTGNVEASWYAYQLELASEKLLWGRPLCNISNRYSVNLGPGVLGASRSLTDHLGFLAMEAWSSCISCEDSIPPYCIWTRSESIGKCMTRAAGLHDYIDGKSIVVIGRRLVCALLQDLYEIGKVGTFFRFAEYLSEMKAEKCRFQTVGSITCNSLCETLEAKRRLAPHMVFGSLCHLIRKADMPIKDVLSAGLKDLKLTHFPAVQTYDKHGHPVLSWSFRSNFWRIVYNGTSREGLPMSVQIYSDLVRGELEKRGVIFPSKLKTIRGPLPWLSSCLNKLVGENLDDDRAVTTLAFVSCIAFVMEGWFVDYDRVKDLTAGLPISQRKLISLEILSKLQLANVRFKDLTLHRLHHSIPHQLMTSQAALSRAQSEEEMPMDSTVYEECANETHRRIGGDDEDDVVVSHDVNIEQRMATCKPVNVTKKSWSGKELEILDDIVKTRGHKSLTEMYNAYREKCLQERVAFRTKDALRFKIRRLAVISSKHK